MIKVTTLAPLSIQFVVHHVQTLEELLKTIGEVAARYVNCFINFVYQK